MAFLYTPEQYNAPDVNEKLIVSVEDTWNFWPLIKDAFESRAPFKRATLNNKTKNPVALEKLLVEFITSTDSRLRSRPEGQRTPFWFRHPYCHLIVVTCEDSDEYKAAVRPRLRSMVASEYREWLILYVVKSTVTDAAIKAAKRVYARLEDDFNTKKRERCCKLDLFTADAAAWEEIEAKIVECIRYTLDTRVQYYEEEVKKLSENRFLPGWNFVGFHMVKESLAFMFEMAQLREDALREYDELEQCFLEVALSNEGKGRPREFGGTDTGDDRAALLQRDRKPFRTFVLEDSVKEFDYRQYVFARQATLLFALGRPGEVADRGLTFVQALSRSLGKQERQLPFCFRESWVFTACMTLVKATTERHQARTHANAAATEQNLYRLQADLYSYARTKLIRLADVVGRRSGVEISPCNSAALSMSPWPRPAVWPSLPADGEARAAVREQENVAEASADAARREESRGATTSGRKDLALAPNALAPEANRRRAAGQPDPGGGNAPRPLGPIMTLAQVQVAAEAHLLKTLSHDGLRKALSSRQAFEELYLELTRAAADNYHRSSRRRHGVVMDGEVAAVYYKRGNLDSAVKLYEKLCALYAAERWNGLLASVLPRLSECQRQLGDVAGYLGSCMRLLALEDGLLTQDERLQLQREFARVARSGLQDPVSLDISSLLTFATKGGPPLDFCEGDPGSIDITIWSGFPEGFALDSLSLTLQATSASASDEAKVVKSTEPPVLNPGKNVVPIAISPQRQGTYVLQALTGLLGRVRLRTHTHCSTSAAGSKGGSPDSDQHLSSEKPLRPALHVAAARPLVEVGAVVASGLLLGEVQWAGVLVKALDYSLQGALLRLSVGNGLVLEEPQMAHLELVAQCTDGSALPEADAEGTAASVVTGENGSVPNGTPVNTSDGTGGAGSNPRGKLVEMRNGAIALPDWASETPTIVWVRVRGFKLADEQSTNPNILAYTPTPSPSPAPTKAHNTPLGTPPRGSTLPPTPPNGTPDTGGRKTGYANPPQQQRLSKWVDEQSERAEAEGGIRMLSVKLEFGAGRGREFQKALSLHFAEPFAAADRVVSKSNDGTMLLQVVLRSQLEATVTVTSARLELQSNFVPAQADQSPSSIDTAWLLPLTVHAGSEGALLFTVKPAPATVTAPEPVTTNGDGTKRLSISVPSKASSMLVLEYTVQGDRRYGAHSPVEGQKSATPSTFRHSFVLQMPVLEKRLAVGLLPLSGVVTVGRALVLQWRVERLVGGEKRLVTGEGEDGETDGEAEELSYEIKAGQEQWMIAGRRKGRLTLERRKGAFLVVSMACVPIVTGHVHPPALKLPGISRGHISHSPAGPHLVCVLPPATSSAFCAMKSS